MIAKCLLRQTTTKTYIFDYKISPGMKIQIYQLAEVPFGNKKIEAIVLEIKNFSKFASKEILRTLSGGSIITKKQLNIAQKIAFEFFSDISSAIFSFLPRLNKKDLSKISSQNSPKIRHRKTGVLIFSGELSLRLNFYIEKLNSSSQNLLIFPDANLLQHIKERILKINPLVKIEIWHSQISKKKKAKIWQDLISGESITIISTRHGLFLPFTDLELIALDDPNSFGYYEDQMPRYNALIAAKIVAKEYSCQLIYGDSLPSLETYAWARKKKATWINQQGKISIVLTAQFHNIFSNPDFSQNDNRSKKILVCGFFSNKPRYICKQCSADNPKTLQCSNCQSTQLRTSVFHLDNVKKLTSEIFGESHNKITISSFKDLRKLNANFDIAIVPFFDIFSSFPYLNFKLRLIKHLLDLKELGIRKIYLCQRDQTNLSLHAQKNDFEKIITESLVERQKEKLPPYTRALEFIGKDPSPLDQIISRENWVKYDDQRYITFISHKNLRKLQSFVQRLKYKISLRLDPPEFS